MSNQNQNSEPSEYKYLSYVRSMSGCIQPQLTPHDPRHHDNPNREYLDSHLIVVHRLTDDDRRALTAAGFGNYIRVATTLYPYPTN